MCTMPLGPGLEWDSLLSELRAVRVLLYHFYLFGSIDTFIRATEWSLHLTGWWMNAHSLITLFRYLRMRVSTSFKICCSYTIHIIMMHIWIEKVQAFGLGPNNVLNDNWSSPWWSIWFLNISSIFEVSFLAIILAVSLPLGFLSCWP